MRCNRSELADTVGRLVERAAERDPEALAFTELDREPLAYGQLASLVSQTSMALAARGLGRGDRIAGVLTPGLHQAACFLGVASVATYAPLAHDWTARECGDYLDRLRPRALILQAGSGSPAAEVAAERGVPVIDLVVDPARPAGWFDLQGGSVGPARAITRAGSDDLAVVLQSSGTTSRPKLIPCRHRQLLAGDGARIERFGLSAKDRVLLFYGFIHGGAIRSDLLLLLRLGGTLISGYPFSTGRFFRVLDELRPTCLAGSNTVLQAIADEVDEHRDIVERARQSFRYFRAAIGSVHPDVVARLEQAFDAPVVESYGLSEIGYLTCNPLPPGVRKHGTVGPLHGNEARIVDEAGSVLPAGEGGEILVRGPNLIDEYLDDAAATAASFTDGWLRTGDVGRFDADGYLSITGRLKEMISQGGDRIAPLEVDRVLAAHPALADAATFAVPHARLGETVGAAVVPKPGIEVDETALRRYCLGELAPYKVPRRIYVVDRIPRDANGKLPRRRLVELLGLEAVPDTAIGRPGRRLSATEAALSGLWASVLEVDAVGVDDDFFAIGGDSLQAATLIAAVEKVFSVTLSLETVIGDASSVAAMARVVDRQRRGRAASAPPKVSALVPIGRHEAGTPVFAVPGIGGNAIGFAPLADHLGDDFCLYGFQSRGLDGREMPLRRLDEIARRNIVDLLGVQPSGPYYLFGACFGAVVAYEMAQQLRAAGRDVGLLAMLDPHGPGASESVSDDSPYRMPSRFPILRFAGDRLVLHYRQLKDLDGPARRRFVREKLALVGQAVRERDLFRGDRAELHRQAVTQSNFAALQDYMPMPYDGPAVIFLSSERDVADGDDARLMWVGLIADPARVHHVSGRDSGDALKAPHVARLAKRLSAELAGSRPAARRHEQLTPLPGP